jgi:carboxypeptidase family protein
VALAGTLTPVRAQSVVLAGEISGQIIDQSGAVVPGATIDLRHLLSGAAQSTQSNSLGIYRFPALVPGEYSLTVKTLGFHSVQTTVQVFVGSTAYCDFKLHVGASQESVKVDSTSTALGTAESSQSHTLDGAFIEDLPLNGRRYTDFTLLIPNTAPDGDTGLVSIAGQQGGEDSGYGNGNGTNVFTVDGTNATNTYFADILGRYRIPYLYGENSIQEFQVAQSPYSAIYGGGTGFVNAVTRSGGDSFHGEVFYFNRNSALAANDSISKQAGYPRQDDSLQQFGGNFGGPILRNGLWFFADYEGQRENAPISIINSALDPTQPGFLSNNFALPDGTTLPAPNAPYPVPGNDTAPDPNDPVYLQQVSNTIHVLNSNLGVQPRRKNDFDLTPRIDFRPAGSDALFLSMNVNRFDSPGGVITVSPVASYGKQTLANAQVHEFQASFGWTHSFSSRLVHEFHAGSSDDNQISTPTGLAAGAPTIIIDNPSFVLGNAPFSVGRVFERQYSVADRIDETLGRHTLQMGFDFNRAWDADNNFGGADPNAEVQSGSFLGSYQFSSLESFALGQYNTFSQSAGNPTFAFAVPYYGFYLQDSFRAARSLTLDAGVREDFQVYPQPAKNPAFPLTGQYPNRFLRLVPRFGFAWAADPKTVVRGGFGVFYTNLNGLNYRNAVVSNGLASQQSSLSQMGDPSVGGNQQLPVFPNILPGSSALFAASPDISLVSPQFTAPYVLQSSLQIERELIPGTIFSIGTMWTHAVHLISGSAYDANLYPLQGTTTYITCPANTDPSATSCSGPQIRLPNMDNSLLAEGYLNPNFGEINELISPGQNHYNSLFVELKRRMRQGLAYQFSYTFAKTMVLDGVDFNNQFDFSNTHAPSLLDMRHNLSIAAVFEPKAEAWMHSAATRALLSDWKLSTVMAFSSGRPYAGLLSPSAIGDNLNDSAFNEDTANTAGGINGAGPTPGIGLNSFYGPWLERIDLGLGRKFPLAERAALQLQVQAFNLFNHANYYVQNGNGINQLEYNPAGPNCGDGQTLNQTCYLIPNSGPGNFGTLQEISPNGTPRILQFSARLSF